MNKPKLPPKRTGYLPFKRYLFWNLPDGWKDLGEKRAVYKPDSQFLTVHSFCGSRINIGKFDDGELFTYCPRCLLITRDPQ